MNPRTDPGLVSHLVGQRGPLAIALVLVMVASIARGAAPPPQVPDAEYQRGAAVDEVRLPGTLVWKEPNEVGLSLGIAHLKAATPLPSGGRLTIAYFVRNTGDKAVRFSSSGYNCRGIRGRVRDGEGRLRPFIGIPMTFFPPRRYHLDPGHLVALDVRPHATTNTAPVEPGPYSLEFEVGLGKWIGDPPPKWVMEKPRFMPGEGEWTGVLRGKPIKLHVNPAPPSEEPRVRLAGPGDLVERRDLRLRFKQDEVSVSGRDGLPKELPRWAPPNHRWKREDGAGDYRASWLGNSSKIWLADARAVQLLKLVPANPPRGGERKFWRWMELADGGRWPIAEASGPLGGIPKRVRQALQLPALGVEVPDAAYDDGIPPPLPHLPGPFTWGDPNEDGLALGVTLGANSTHPAGKPVRWGLYVANRSNKTVKLSSFAPYNHGMRARLRGANGHEYLFVRPAPILDVQPHRVELDTGHVGAFTVPSHPIASYWITPGRYELEIELALGDWIAPAPPAVLLDDPAQLPGKGEWSGILRSKKIPITITPAQAPEIGSAGVGGSVISPAHHRIEFKADEIVLSQMDLARAIREGGELFAPVSSWKIERAVGDYRAAWEDDAWQRLWLGDAQGVTLLNIVPTVSKMDPGRVVESFEKARHWPREKLDGIPAGVRSALFP